MTALPGPGIYPDIPNAVYHREWVHAESKSNLWPLLDCPARYRWIKDQPPAEPTPAMILGSATHTLVYEPEKFDAEFAVSPDFNLRTNAGKADAADFAARNAGKQILRAEDAEIAGDMAAVVRSNAAAMREIEGCRFENSILWRDAETGILCKCRPDGWRPGVALNDLKTTKSLDGFHWDADSFGYYFQAAFYRIGVHAATGEWLPFRFIAVEKEPPYLVRIFEPSDNTLHLAGMVVRDTMRLLARCRDRDDWPGLDTLGPAILDPERLKGVREWK